MDISDNKQCYFCNFQTLHKSLDNWIEEKHYLGSNGQTLKEVLVGDSKSKEKREPIAVVYYCSLECMHEQMDKEEDELWKM